MVARVAVLGAIAAASGCYAPTFQDCELACAPSGSCPAGFECQTNVCRPIGTTTPCPVPGMIDAPDTDSMMVDSPMGMPPHPTTMWSTPNQVTAGPNGMDDPSLTDDRLIMYVGVGSQIHVATRTSDSANWMNFVQATELSGGGASIDDAPYLSPDGLRMMWMSSRAFGMGGNDIWQATRPDRMSPFSNVVNVSALNSTELDAGGSISADGLLIVFASSRASAASGTSDLFYATRSSPTSTWGGVNRLTELNTTVDESHPILSPDKLTIYFHRFVNQTQQYELFEAHRPSATQPFGMPRQLTELSTAGYEGDPWVSRDGRHMFFTRIVGGIKQIYETSR